MAFFGLTYLGYQNPIGDKMIVNPRGASHIQDCEVNSAAGRLPPLPSDQKPQEPLRCIDMFHVYNKLLPYSSNIHHGSQERYKEMVKRVQTPRSPNLLYITPLTESQWYGWLVTKERPEPWTQVKRFPRKNSEMTKFVQEMLLVDREFILF
ncbi:hypothetical protein LDENG_00178240 [Lucifuga dentata]|nr:hypothetical protein LDENG_00178240 [Lucifuga dentata]